MKQVTYEQGNTTVWSDGDKVIIKNPVGRKYIEQNVDQIFGVGEYQRIYKVKYYENVSRGRNPLSRKIEISSGYIPDRVKKDLDIQSLPGISEEDLMGKYFK